jgi:hypothetical protein
VLWSSRAECLGAYGVQMNHTLIEPFCRRELGRKRGQGHWRCWQAPLLAPTPSEQTWQQWHLLWNSRNKVRQSDCLANLQLPQVTTTTVNKAYCNSEINHSFCIFIPSLLSFLPLSYLLPSLLLYYFQSLSFVHLITITVPSFNTVPFYKTRTRTHTHRVYGTAFILQMAQV